jgi:chemotaxis signal transduction protein
MNTNEHERFASAESAWLSPTAALDDDFVLPSAPATDVGQAKTAAVAERLGFRIGDLGLLCSETDGSEVVEPPPASRLPNTPTWLKGLANVRGTLVPVVDLAMAFDIPRDAAARPYLLVIGHAEEVIGLLVDGLPGRQLLEARERLGSLPPYPDVLRGHVKAGYDHAERVWLDLDVAGFFASLSGRIDNAA